MRSTPVFALLLLAVTAACAPKAPPQPDPVPVSVEPTFTGKYK